MPAEATGSCDSSAAENAAHSTPVRIGRDCVRQCRRERAATCPPPGRPPAESTAEESITSTVRPQISYFSNTGRSQGVQFLTKLCMYVCMVHLLGSRFPCVWAIKEAFCPPRKAGATYRYPAVGPTISVTLSTATAVQQPQRARANCTCLHQPVLGPPTSQEWHHQPGAWARKGSCALLSSSRFWEVGEQRPTYQPVLGFRCAGSAAHLQVK